jgi:hypothetical protein
LHKRTVAAMLPPMSPLRPSSVLVRFTLAAALLSPLAPVAARSEATVGTAPTPQRLPDGIFHGPVWIEDAAKAAAPRIIGHIRLLVVHGFLVAGTFTAAEGGATMELNHRTTPDDPELRLAGRGESGFLMLAGAFRGRSAGHGTFEGGLGGRRAAGFWAVTRQ